MYQWLDALQPQITILYAPCSAFHYHECTKLGIESQRNIETRFQIPIFQNQF